MSNSCSHEALLHFSLQCSHLSICYYHQDLHSGLFHLGLHHWLRRKAHALLLTSATALQQWLGINRTLKRYPFSGPVHSAGELLHTPERFSTSMTTVLLLI
jgi:hypothetical protein